MIYCRVRTGDRRASRRLGLRVVSHPAALSADTKQQAPGEWAGCAQGLVWAASCLKFL